MVKNSVNELFIPSLLIGQPQIFNFGWISKSTRLNNKRIVNMSPIFTPRRALDRNLPLCFLVERMCLEDREYLYDGCPEGRFWHI
jgi:hypothetical protein